MLTLADKRRMKAFLGGTRIEPEVVERLQNEIDAATAPLAFKYLGRNDWLIEGQIEHDPPAGIVAAWHAIDARLAGAAPVPTALFTDGGPHAVRKQIRNVAAPWADRKGYAKLAAVLLCLKVEGGVILFDRRPGTPDVQTR
jgi:hypothetical protein